MPERRYDEGELAAILRAAAEIQAEGEAPSDLSGYSLRDIERVASEVGIEPRHIAAAASQLESKTPRQRKFLFWGAPVREVHERVADGLLTDEQWEEVVAELRAGIGSVGTVGEMGTSREWTGGTETTSAHLSATPRQGRTRFRLAYKQEGALIIAWLCAFVSIFLIMILVGVTMWKHGAPGLTIWSILIPVIAAIYLMTHGVMARWGAKNRAKIEEMMARLIPYASTSVVAPFEVQPLEEEPPVNIRTTS